MIKLKIKSGDIVRVIAGDHKGAEGKVLRVYKEKNKAIVEGVNMVSKHTKPRKNTNKIRRYRRCKQKRYHKSIYLTKRKSRPWSNHSIQC